MKRTLLLGAGFSRERRMGPAGLTGAAGTFENVTTLDNNPDAKPDLLADLSDGADLARLRSNCREMFDEIHAYEVLEHCGAQGDHVLFFFQFCTFWHILKPGGYVFATVPAWDAIWAWGDPSHSRVINEGSLVFLDRKQYAAQLGRTPMSDYRRYLGECSFRTAYVETRETTFAFILQKE